jgi:hypothetical protein
VAEEEEEDSQCRGGRLIGGRVGEGGDGNILIGQEEKNAGSIDDNVPEQSRIVRNRIFGRAFGCHKAYLLPLLMD